MTVTPNPLVGNISEGKFVAVVGDVYTILATGDTTNGQYALFYAFVSPGGGPPPHVHSREDEMVYVLEEEITFYLNGQEIKGNPGTFFHLPKGIKHHFKNAGNKPAKALIQVLPAGLEKFFEEAGQKVDGPSESPPPATQEDYEKLKVVAPRYGMEILVPDSDTPYLELVSGMGRGKIILLEKTKIILGRDPSCDIHLDNASVSRRHTQLVRTTGGYLVEDFGSTSGTRVNGNQLKSRVALGDRDIIRIGSVILIYHG